MNALWFACFFLKNESESDSNVSIGDFAFWIEKEIDVLFGPWTFEVIANALNCDFGSEESARDDQKIEIDDLDF